MKRKLSFVLGQYTHLQPLRDGAIESDLVTPEFVDFPAVGRAFNAMLEDQRYDVCEMALVAFLQAVERSVPIRMLPLVTLGGFVHEGIFFRPAAGSLSPYALAGTRIGVRSYSQTTGVWARALLEEQFGFDIKASTWITTDDAHVPGFTDPPCVRNLGTKGPVQELLSTGMVDAAILHPTHNPAADFAPLIDDAPRASEQWFEAHRSVPINHVICVGPSVWSDPRLVEEVYSLLTGSYRAAGVPAADDRDPVTYDAPRISGVIDLVSTLAARQGLVGPGLDVSQAVLRT